MIVNARELFFVNMRSPGLSAATQKLRPKASIATETHFLRLS